MPLWERFHSHLIYKLHSWKNETAEFFMIVYAAEGGINRRLKEILKEKETCMPFIFSTCILWQYPKQDWDMHGYKNESRR